MSYDIYPNRVLSDKVCANVTCDDAKRDHCHAKDIIAKNWLSFKELGGGFFRENGELAKTH